MKSETLKANTIGELTKLVEDFRDDVEIVSITYHFNSIEYYKNLDHYIEAIIEYK